MAGIVDHGDIGIARLAAEIAQRPPHVADGQIVARVNDLEIGLPEGVGEHRRVVGGVGKPGDVAISRIADHKRNAFSRKGRLPKER